MAEIAPGTTTGPAPSDIPPEITARAAEAVRRSAKRTREVFAAEFGRPSALQKPPQPDVAPSDPSPYDRAQRASVAARIRREHADVRELPAALAAKQANAQAGLAARKKKPKTDEQRATRRWPR